MHLDADSRRRTLRALTDSYLDLALTNIALEFPAYPWYVATRPGPYPTHREAHPVFFGSFDWHSCVEMYWVVVRLLRLAPETKQADRAVAQLDAFITTAGMEREHAFFLDPVLQGFERPYGWGWYLALAYETTRLDHPAAQRWSALLHPLAKTIEQKFIQWLPKLTYPQRVGMHPNTAFALTLAYAWAEHQVENNPDLLIAIEMAAHRYFLRDTDYPAHYEPSGADFLSAALTEAVLMQRILDSQAFLPWLEDFLPGLPEKPASILHPAIVSDPTDGQGAHLHGLNLSRAWGWMILANSLPEDDPRRASMIGSAEEHADASSSAVAGSDYMVGHWLVAYAILLLTFDER